MTIGDFDNPDTLRVSPSKSGRYVSGYPSINNFGATITQGFDFNIGDTVLYTDTSIFQASGEILVGDEVISYTSKLADRFLGITRAVNGTIEKNHPAGDYIRTFWIQTL